MEDPARAAQDRPPVPVVRLAVLAAALALALASRGDVVVLAVLLGLGASRRVPAVAIGTGLAAAMVRWGSPSLGAIAGAQAVLGPAGWTGAKPAVASAWLGAAAVLLAAERLDITPRALSLLSATPFAVASADIAVGPGPGGALALRVVATAIACALTIVVVRLPGRAWIALGCGLAALVCAGVAR